MARLLELVYLMLPAYFANMAPPFVKFWPGWNRPIAPASLGTHKTVVGFASGVLLGLVVAYGQSVTDLGVRRWWVSDAWLAVGVAQGFGAMMGDAVKSYFKRRIGIAPGAPWVPADQLDFVVGALIPLALIVPLGAGDVALILGFTFFADIVVNHMSFYLGIRDSRW